MALTAAFDFLRFGLRVLAALPMCILDPANLLACFARFARGTCGLAIVVGLSLGIVTWMHIGQLLGRFEAGGWLPTVLTAAVVAEFGPISVGLLAAARLGSGIAAELAAMKVSEQLDALDCLGTSPVRHLVVPRVLACCLLLPPLTVVVDYSAFLGAYAAEALAGDLALSMFASLGFDHLDLLPAILSTLKPLVFGLLVGTISCWHGINAEHSTEAVGTAATRAVVHSVVAVLIANVICVWGIQRLTS